jgi:hypothetical protein
LFARAVAAIGVEDAAAALSVVSAQKAEEGKGEAEKEKETGKKPGGCDGRGRARLGTWFREWCMRSVCGGERNVEVKVEVGGCPAGGQRMDACQARSAEGPGRTEGGGGGGGGGEVPGSRGRWRGMSRARMRGRFETSRWRVG